MQSLLVKLIKYTVILLIVLAFTPVWAAAQAAAAQAAAEEPAGDVPAAEKSVRDEEVGGLSQGRKFIPAAEEPAVEELAVEEPAEDEEVGGLGEGRKWLPAVSFPPADPDSIEGEVYFWDRDFQIDFAYSNLHISKMNIPGITVSSISGSAAGYL
jgi:hypothetical protein